MNLYYFHHCQKTKSKDFLLTNGDEGFTSFELGVDTILDFFKCAYSFTLQFYLY